MISIKEKIKDKNSIFYMAYKVLTSQIITSLILFFSSIILIRSLSKDDYGLYVLTISYFAFFELLLGGFDASLIRYIPISGKKEQHNLIATIISIKTFILFIIYILILGFYNYVYIVLNIPNDKVEIFKIMYIIISVSFIFKYMITTFSTIINAFMLYDLMFKISILNAIVTLIISILVWIFKLEVWQYVLLSVLWTFFYMNILGVVLYRYKKLSLKYLKTSFSFIIVKNTFKNKVLKYSLPLFGVGILSYIKNYLPNFIFGSMISLESLAVYNIFTKIINILHKGYASFLQKLYPKLFKMVDSKSKSIDKLFWIGLFIRIFIFILLYFSYNYINILYKISVSDYNYLIFLVLISGYLIMYFATFSNLLIMSNSSTYYLFKASVIRNISSIVLIYYGFNIYNINGLLFSLFFVNVIGSSYVWFNSYDKMKITNKKIYGVLYITIFIFLLLILLKENL